MRHNMGIRFRTVCINNIFHCLLILARVAVIGFLVYNFVYRVILISEHSEYLVELHTFIDEIKED